MDMLTWILTMNGKRFSPDPYRLLILAKQNVEQAFPIALKNGIQYKHITGHKYLWPYSTVNNSCVIIYLVSVIVMVNNMLTGTSFVLTILNLFCQISNIHRNRKNSNEPQISIIQLQQ